MNKLNEPVRVLYFVDRMLRGGIQSLVLNWVTRFDRNKVQVDFLLLDDGVSYELEERFRSLGCNVYKLDGIWIKKPSDYIRQYKALDNFFKNHNDYKVVHLHSTSKNFLVMKVAEKYGIPIRIAHSHATDFMTKNKVKKIFGNILKNELIRYSNRFMACSESAGSWLFGEKIIESPLFSVIHNGVDLDDYTVTSKRAEIRMLHNISNECTVLGCVGRFVELKNHKFLVEIFEEYHRLNNNSMLLLVGTGELEDSIKELVKRKQLDQFVVFAGFKENVNEYLMAMDAFVFPSKFEGLGLVLIEAQASGIKCFASKKVIPNDAKVSDLLTFIDLDEKPLFWAEKIFAEELNRKDVKDSIKHHHYDIGSSISKLEEIYLS